MDPHIVGLILPRVLGHFKELGDSMGFWGLCKEREKGGREGRGAWRKIGGRRQKGEEERCFPTISLS